MRTETKWASIAAVALLLFLILAKMTGWHSAEKWDTGSLVGIIFSVVLFIWVYYMTCKQKRDAELNGVMSWQEGFWACARMTLIYIPLSCLVFYMYIKGINPEFGEVYLKKLTEAGGYIGKDPVNDNLSIHLIASFVFGGLFSLLFPIFTRRGV